MEGLFDVAQPYGLGDESIEIQSALQVQIDQHREVP
jgi:hypothetical protein